MTPVYLDYYNVPYCLLPFLQLSPYTESGEGQPTKVTHDWLGDLASVFSQDRAQVWPKGQGPEKTDQWQGVQVIVLIKSWEEKSSPN